MLVGEGDSRGREQGFGIEGKKKSDFLAALAGGYTGGDQRRGFSDRRGDEGAAPKGAGGGERERVLSPRSERSPGEEAAKPRLGGQRESRARRGLHGHSAFKKGNGSPR